MSDVLRLLPSSPPHVSWAKQRLRHRRNRYQNMDRMWRKALTAAKKNPGVIGYCSNVSLLETWKECNKLLDQVLDPAGMFF